NGGNGDSWRDMWVYPPGVSDCCRSKSARDLGLRDRYSCSMVSRSIPASDISDQDRTERPRRGLVEEDDLPVPDCGSAQVGRAQCPHTLRGTIAAQAEEDPWIRTSEPPSTRKRTLGRPPSGS